MDKSAKYDRQLRLWAANGQTNIENCHICVIGITTTNIEVLKNLILPGCGEFTIITNEEPKDASHNFFWSETPSSIIDNLQELNPDVHGKILEETPEQLIAKNDASFWSIFTIVIMDDSIKSWDEEHALLSIFWEHNIPVIKNSSYGFYGYTKVMVKEHCITETHPESLVDLRVDNAWPELEAYSDSIKLEELDETDHAHIPFSVILVKAVQSWKRSHNNKGPTSRDRAEFKSTIEQMSRSPAEINFQEALQSAHRATNPPVLRAQVAELINSCPEPNLTTPLFWIYTKALQQFMKEHNNQLPLSGVLPDMASDTSNYVKLQQIYKKKFNEDRDALLTIVRSIIATIGRSQDEAVEEMANIFCKNARFLIVQNGSKELVSPKSVMEYASSAHQANYFKIYLAFLAVENMKKTGADFKLYAKDENYETLLASLKSLMSQKNIPEDTLDDGFHKILQEFARSAGTELHNMASLMGGIGSQEALKFITAQYVPIDNTFIFDGIISHGECLKI